MLAEFVNKYKEREDKIRGVIFSWDGETKLILWSEIQKELVGLVSQEIIDDVFTLVSSYNPDDGFVCLVIQKDKCKLFVISEKKDEH